MPNWVRQIMTVVNGDPQEVWDTICGEEKLFDFDKLVPMPKEVKESKEMVGSFPAWFAWAVQHWGTKWNTGVAKFETDKDCKIAVTPYRLCFETAWSCPVPIFKLLAEKFPEHEITIRAYECAMCWHATFTLKDGQLTGLHEECHCFDEACEDLKGDADAAAQDELDAMEKNQNGKA
jgi:hypothetical protein